jgi:hypothetical protein
MGRRPLWGFKDRAAGEMLATLMISIVFCSLIIHEFFNCFYRGLVPLHNACSYGHYEVAELLVKVCTNNYNVI